MQRPHLPDAIRVLADARQAARDARDFAEADRLKADIEAAGWAVVDQATSYRLHRAYPADVTTPDGRVLYGWSGAVPSRLDAEAVGAASVVLVAPDDPDALERALAALAGVISDDVQRIVVANAPGPETETLLARVGAQWVTEAAAAEMGGGPVAEVVWTVARFGAAAALNAGLRRASAAVVIIVDALAGPVGDFATPLVTVLEDPSIAVAGPWGLASPDQRRFEPVSVADAGALDVTAISLAAMAFRRADYVARGPLDEHFVDRPLLDAWWSLVLRDPEGDEMTPRRAVLIDVPLVHPAADGPTDPAVERRNRYRIIATFGGRRDLAVPRVP